MNHAILLAVIYLAFISLGLPDTVLGVAWPSMRLSLQQPVEVVGLISLVVTACSALSSFASSAVLKRLGTGTVVMLSGMLTGLALLGFSVTPSFALLLVLAIPLGLGAGSVDTALNHFVAQHYASRHMNWLHACWGIGATTGPLIMGAALASQGGWSQGYQHIASIQLGLALLFLLTLKLWSTEPVRPDDHPHAEGQAAPKPLNPKAPWLAATLCLVYAAIEAGIGLWTGSVLVESRQFSAATAGLWSACFFGAVMSGRVVSGWLAPRLGNRRLIRYGLCLALFGAAVFSLPDLPHALSLAGLIVLGLGCAPVYPSLLHETSHRFTAEVARQVMGKQVGFAYIGCSAVPAALGLLAAWAGLSAVVPAVMLAMVLLLVLSEALNRIT